METNVDDLEGLPTPRSKCELMQRIPPARAALEVTLNGLSDQQMTAPGADGWSVKDHLAHLATWERMIVAHLTDGRDHEVVGLGEVVYAKLDLEALNTVIERRTKDLSLDVVRDDFRSAHEQVVALIGRLTDEELNRPYWSDDPSGRSVADKIAGDTYRHYLEHRRWIIELVSGDAADERAGSL